MDATSNRRAPVWPNNSVVTKAIKIMIAVGFCLRTYGLLCQLCLGTQRESARKIFEAIEGSALDFAEASDDISVVVIKRT